MGGVKYQMMMCGRVILTCLKRRTVRPESKKIRQAGAKAVNAVGYGSPVVCLRGGVVVGKYGWWEIP
jgi:hypothetical protein